MSNRLKGLNPFIATVLLILVSITVFGIFSKWIISYVSSLSAKTGKEGEEKVICGYAGSINIEEVDYCDTTNTLNITITNSGSISLGNITLQIIYTTKVEKKSLCLVGDEVVECQVSNLTLQPGDYRRINLNLTISPALIDSVIFTTNCTDVTAKMDSAYFNRVC